MEKINKRSSAADKIETQQFLDRTYELVALKLEDLLYELTDVTHEELKNLRSLAKDVNTSDSDTHVLASEREKIIKHMSWLPVAQECVVTFLRAIFEKSKTGKIELDMEKLREITNEISSHENFSLNLGLNPADAKTALSQTRDTIVKHAMIAKPLKFAVDDNIYLVHCENDLLVVEPTA